MSRVSSTYQRLLRREVVDICVFIFIADVVTGVQLPVFPLFTTSLGASLGMLGLITAVLGLTRLASALPIGVVSDRVDRKTVLVAGMLMFALAFVIYSLAPNPTVLLPARVAQGIAMVATFPLGIAYIGDVVEPRDRGAAIGVYTAAMGSGFAVGPLIGSWFGATHGYPSAYAVGALIAVAGAGYGAIRLIRKRPVTGEAAVPARALDMRALAALARKPVMIVACVGNVAMTLSTTGAIFTYFPVYARSVGIGTVAIGTLFAWRSIASASGRLPMGPLAYRLPAYWTLSGVLAIEAGIDLVIAHTTSALVLAIVLVLEGIGFGVFLVSGQSAVASAAGPSNRGAAIGMFWMAGSLGDLFGPIALGAVAQTLGLIAVFQAVAACVALVAAFIAGVGLVARVRTTTDVARAS